MSVRSRVSVWSACDLSPLFTVRHQSGTQARAVQTPSRGSQSAGVELLGPRCCACNGEDAKAVTSGHAGNQLFIRVVRADPKPDVAARHRRGNGPVFPANAGRPDERADFFEVQARMPRVGAPKPVVLEGEMLDGTRQGAKVWSRISCVARAGPRKPGGATGVEIFNRFFLPRRFSGPPGRASRAIFLIPQAGFVAREQSSSFPDLVGGQSGDLRFDLFDFVHG